MTDLSELTELATLLQNRPDLEQPIQNAHPKEWEQISSLIQAPFFSFSPFVGVDGNPAQAGFLQADHRNKWCITGNRCGKTVSGLYEDVSDCLGIHPITRAPSEKFDHPPRVWVVSDTEETSIDVIERTIVEQILGEDETGVMWNWVDDKSKYSKASGFSDHTLTWTTGADIRFKFSTQKRKTFQGVRLDKVHLDEEQPPEIYGECRARLVDLEGYMLGTMTPIYEKSKGLSWIYEELYLPREQKGIQFHNWSLFDNPHIPENEKRKLIEEWDEDEIEARVYGMFVPMGVKLALPRELIRKIRGGIEAPASGNITCDEEGNIVWQTVAA
jgi:hypothetical protein